MERTAPLPHLEILNFEIDIWLFPWRRQWLYSVWKDRYNLNLQGEARVLQLSYLPNTFLSSRAHSSAIPPSFPGSYVRLREWVLANGMWTESNMSHICYSKAFCLSFRMRLASLAALDWRWQNQKLEAPLVIESWIRGKPLLTRNTWFVLTQNRFFYIWSLISGGCF